MNVEKIFDGEGGYVFVSHSHLDLQEVRTVRNFLEKSGMEPILFYLRSMENGGEERGRLLRQLIYEEIDAREFFLYLESTNAQKSEWVQEEIRYVREKYPEKLVVVPLAQGETEAKKQLQALVKKMRVFISHSGADFLLTQRLKGALVKRDFRVYINEDNSPGTAWKNQMKKTVKDVSKEGSVIILLTRRSVQSVYVEMELRYALKCEGRVVPILVGDVDLSGTRLEFLKDYTHFRLEEPESDESLEKFVDQLTKELKK